MARSLFSTDEVVFALPNPTDGLFTKAGTTEKQTTRDLLVDSAKDGKKLPIPLKPIRMRFTNANPSVAITTTQFASFTNNYLVGSDSSQWKTNVPLAETITYQGLYNGIDVAYTGSQGQLKRTFTVAPGADPGLIAWTYTGQNAVQLDAAGNLAVAVDMRHKAATITKENAHVLFESAPIAWQIIDGEQHPVSVIFDITRKQEVQFKLGTYDRNYELIIDPAITYSTYLGGAGNDWGWDIAVDGEGYSYVVGHTSSVDFPTATSTPASIVGSTDVFVTKYTPAGDRIVYTTFLGGANADRGMAIDIDSTGRIWIAGFTSSLNFPTLRGYQTNLSAGNDAFVAELSPNGQSLMYSSLLGGTGNDDATELVIDAAGKVYIHGTTYSTNLPTRNAFQGASGGGADGFAAKFDTSLSGGSSLIYSSYVGGSGDDWGYGLDVNAAGNAYLTGFTQSANFPVFNAYQPVYGGNRDAYLIKLSVNGYFVEYGTYLGGSAFDEGRNVVVGTNGDYYVGGGTTSTNFPRLNAQQSTIGGGQDGWITKFNSWNSMMYSTYVGGDGADGINSLAVNADHQLFVSGSTNTTFFPLGGGYRASNGGWDVFVRSFNADGYSAFRGSLFGGSNDDWGDGLAVDYASNVYLTGGTSSPNLPLVDAQQGQYKGGNEAFVVMIDHDDEYTISSGETLTKRAIQPATDIDTYYVDLQAGKEVIVRMNRTDTTRGLNSFLTLVDPNGAIIATDNDSGGSGNAKLNRIIAPTTGRYKILAKDDSGTRTGFYSLSLTVGTPATPPTPVPPVGQDPDPCPAPVPATALPSDDPALRGPENANFEQGLTELPRTTYPVNCDFSQTLQVLPTVISPATISFVDGTSSQVTTSNIVVPATAQSIHFKYRIGSSAYGLDKLTLSAQIMQGSTVRQTTELPSASLNDGWQTGVVDVQAFQGLTIQVKFFMNGGPGYQFTVQNFTVNIDVPNWKPSDARFVSIVRDVPQHNNHVRMNGAATITSQTVLVPANAQSLRFDYQIGSSFEANQLRDLYVSVLLPPYTNATATPLKAVSGSHNAGWQTAIIDVRTYRGQNLKLRFGPGNDGSMVMRIDAIHFALETPFWEPSDSAQVQITSANTEASITQTAVLNGKLDQAASLNTSAINNPDRMAVFPQTITPSAFTWSGPLSGLTNAWTVPSTADTLMFRWKSGPTDNERFWIEIFNGATFSIVSPIELPQTGPGWKNAKVDLQPFQGQTIKLRFLTATCCNPSGQVDSFQIVTLLPGWQPINSFNIALIADTATTGHIAFKNYSAFTSQPFFVDQSMTSINFKHQIDNLIAGANPSFVVQILSGESFTVITGVGVFGDTGAYGWRVGKVDIQQFRGQTIRLRFGSFVPGTPSPIYQVHIDDVTIATAIPVWTINDPIRVTRQSDAPNGGFLQFGSYGAATTNSLRVVSTTLQFNYRVGSASSTPGTGAIFVDVLSGGDFKTTTLIHTASGTGTVSNPSPWATASVNLQAWSGRAIKLRFRTTDGSAMLDTIKLVPGTIGTPKASAFAPYGAYLQLAGNGMSAASSYFVVPADAKNLRFMYQVGNLIDALDPRDLEVYVEVQGIANPVRIDNQNAQTLIRANLNDGWKRGQLNIVTYQGKTIRLHFRNGSANSPLARIDKISLLTPRAELAATVGVSGITYLNVPATELGGSTVPATVNINTATVYDEYLDLAGTASYNGQSYAFNLSGDVYRSILGTPSDKVGRLSDLTNTFDVLYFAVRQQPLMPIANPTLTGPNLALYLQRRGTREVVFVDVPLAGGLGTTFGTLFSLAGQYGTPYVADYWFRGLFTPISLTSTTNRTSLQQPQTAEGSFELRTTFPLWPGPDDYICNITEILYYVIIMDGPTDIGSTTSYPFFTNLAWDGEKTISKAQKPSPAANKFCSALNSPNSSSLRIGDPLHSGGVTLKAALISQREGNSDYMIKSKYEGEFKNESGNGVLPQVYINIAIAPPGSPVSLNIARTLIPEGERQASPPESEYYTFSHRDPNTNVRDLSRYRTKVTEYEYVDRYLDGLGDNFDAEFIIAWWIGSRWYGELALEWTITVSTLSYSDVWGSTTYNSSIIYYTGQ